MHIPGYLNHIGIFLLLYREHGATWDGPTGFYGGDFERTPIPPGDSKTWWDFYLWAQNWTPGLETGTVGIAPSVDPPLPPPPGYLGHLVLDYVPEVCNWTGPVEFWLDLSQPNELTLPIATVTDPLDGVQMHITVHAPIPEPSSFAALGFGLVPLAAVLRRRRR